MAETIAGDEIGYVKLRMNSDDESVCMNLVWLAISTIDR